MIVIRRKCFSTPDLSGYESRPGNAFRAPKVKIDGEWMTHPEANEYLQSKPSKSYEVGSTAAETHEKNKSGWVSPWEREQAEREAEAARQGELRSQVPGVIEPGKEQEYLDDKVAADEAAKAMAQANQKRKDDLTKGAMIGAGVAAVGAAGYGAYKAWKKKQAKKKAANAAAEDKFKK